MSKSAIISEDLRLLAGAVSEHNRAANRVWGVAATLAVLVIASPPSWASDAGTIKMLGFEVSATIFHPLASFILALVNITYCVFHIQAYKASEMFWDLAIKKRLREIQITDRATAADYASMLYQSSFSRIHPLAYAVPDRVKDFTYGFLKPLADLFFLSVPIGGCLISMHYSRLEENVLIGMLWFVVFLSVCATILLASNALSWVVGHSRRK